MPVDKPKPPPYGLFGDIPRPKPGGGAPEGNKTWHERKGGLEPVMVYMQSGERVSSKTNPELKRADAPEEFNLTSGELCLLLLLPLSSGDAPKLGLNGALMGGVLPLRPAC